MSTINVNSRATHAHPWPGRQEWCNVDCAPIPISCPLPPRVEMKVVPGECTLGNCYSINPNGTPHSPETGGHGHGCPARPITVTCGINGDTWASSDVGDIAKWGADGLFVPFGSEEQFQACLNTCRDRWALVKALVLGRASTLADITAEPMSTAHMMGLLAQRDAVYAALCEMARAEDTARKATEDLWGVLPESAGWFERHPARDAQTPSAILLARYVERLIEQVGTGP